MSLGFVSPRLFAQATVRVTKIDGSVAVGEWVGTDDGTIITVKTATGNLTLPTDEIAHMQYSCPGGPAQATLEATEEVEPQDAGVEALFHLADGGRLHGTLSPLPGRQSDVNRTSAEESASPDGILANTPLGDAVLLPFDRVAGIQLAGLSADRTGEGREDLRSTLYSRASKAFEAALADRLPGHDVLITRGPEQVRTVRGRLVEVGSTRGTFAFIDRVRGFRTERIFGIVLAAGGRANMIFAQRGDCTFVLSDGSEFSGRIVRGSEDSLTVATGWEGRDDLRLTLPTLEIVRSGTNAATVESGPMVESIRLRSDRVVYLSDKNQLEPRFEGRLHRDWPPRMDQSVSGGSLVLDGRTFGKGIGMHSKTELDFDIAAGFERFVATIGIDDSVRPAGTVVFRVLGDTRVLLDSGVMTGRDESRRVVVDVQGVKKLTLVVDYGDGLDLSDQAVWGEARLLKPARLATVEPASPPAGQNSPARRPELFRRSTGGQR